MRIKSKIFLGELLISLIGCSNNGDLNSLQQGKELNSSQPHYYTSNSSSTPWEDKKLDAVVRVEVKRHLQDEDAIGAGFIVVRDNSAFVITSTHVLYGARSEQTISDDCVPFNTVVNVDFYRREKHIEHLVHNGCSWNRGSDISIIPLKDQENGYPALNLATKDFKQFDEVFIAGYPLGYDLDPTRSGRISTLHGKDDLVVANIATTEGMSGGPYLSSSGNVVGIHYGGIRFNPGFAHFTSILRVKSKIESIIGEIPQEGPNGELEKKSGVFQAVYETFYQAFPQYKPQASIISVSDIEKLQASEDANRITFSMLFALQVIPDISQRFAKWTEFVNRGPTDEEADLIINLPLLERLDLQTRRDLNPLLGTGSAINPAAKNRTPMQHKLSA